MLPATVAESIRLSLMKAESVLVMCHIGPDGDAIASLAATGLALAQLGKRFSLVCDDGLPERFTYLPMADEISVAPPPNTSFDLIIALDASDESRLGQAYASLSSPRPPVINIDHHITNTHFGAINLVQAEATATTEVLFELFVALNLRLDEPMAVCLLSGLVTDTLDPSKDVDGIHPINAGRLMQQIEHQVHQQPFSFLQKTENENLLTFIQEEHPQTIALILSHLPPSQASDIISGLPTERQISVVKRVANMAQTSPEIIQEVEKGLEHRMASVMSQQFENAGGVQSVAEILNQVDNATEDGIFGRLEDEHPELAD